MQYPGMSTKTEQQEELPAQNPQNEIAEIQEGLEELPEQEPVEEEESKKQKTTEEMEVHHHAHHGGPKTWKSYFWEFMMLFLAVFCGSIAEYYLEHRIEKERGIQFVQSMIEDLSSDSAKISATLPYIQQQELGMDSLSQLFHEKNLSDSIVQKMYLQMRSYTVNSAAILFTKRTISQLQNSGGMRLIPSKKTADAITRYSEIVEMIETQGSYYEKNGIFELMKMNQKIFDFHQSGQKGAGIQGKAYHLISTEPQMLGEYSNLLLITSSVLHGYRKGLENLQTIISETNAVLKKEHGL